MAGLLRQRLFRGASGGAAQGERPVAPPLESLIAALIAANIDMARSGGPTRHGLGGPGGRKGKRWSNDRQAWEVDVYTVPHEDGPVSPPFCPGRGGEFRPTQDRPADHPAGAALRDGARPAPPQRTCFSWPAGCFTVRVLGTSSRRPEWSASPQCRSFVQSFPVQ